jgi:chromosome segregation ATPase
MTNVDTSSYSCKELVDYLGIYGTDREKQLIGRFDELQQDINNASFEYTALCCEMDDKECEVNSKDDEIKDLEETIVKLKGKIKGLENE